MQETHSKLLTQVARMSGNRRREQLTEGREGEFALTNDQEAEVSLGDLMGSFTDNPGESGLKKKLSKLEHQDESSNAPVKLASQQQPTIASLFKPKQPKADTI